MSGPISLTSYRADMMPAKPSFGDVVGDVPISVFQGATVYASAHGTASGNEHSFDPF